MFGRIPSFDEASRGWPLAAHLPKGLPAHPVLWKRVGVFDQGDTNACTGMATAGMIVSEPNSTPADPVGIYGQATRLDDVDGEYPPDDTGSTVLGAMKAARAEGLIKTYRWGFGLTDLIDALAHLGPCVIGIAWADSMMEPDHDGLVYLAAQSEPAGGHAIEVIGVDPEKKQVRMVNSWGTSWGQNGRCSLAFDDLDKLLHDEGECAIGRET